VGGVFGLIGGFVGLVGLGYMISRVDYQALDPVGVLLFGLLLLNGLWATWRRLTGREVPRRQRNNRP
jgi:hypothetical protein